MMNITTTKTIKKSFEDPDLNEGRTTAKRKITGEDIDLHAEESGDYFPHHMDAEWCKTQPFKKRMAHGTLVLTIAIGLTTHVINEASTEMYMEIIIISLFFSGEHYYTFH